MSTAEERRAALAPRWQRRFEILDRVEGKYWSKSNELTPSEIFRMFRIFGFLLGPIYYFILGMWQKGLIFVTIAFLGVFLMSILGFDQLANYFGIFVAAICASTSTYDYYHKIQFNEQVWPFLSKRLPKVLTSLPTLVVIAIGAIALNFYDINSLSGRSCADEGVTGVVKQLAKTHYFTSNVPVFEPPGTGYRYYEMDFIRAVSSDPVVNSVVCDAVLTRPSDSNEYSVRYQVSPDEAEFGGVIIELIDLQVN